LSGARIHDRRFSCLTFMITTTHQPSSWDTGRPWGLVPALRAAQPCERPEPERGAVRLLAGSRTLLWALTAPRSRWPRLSSLPLVAGWRAGHPPVASP
jgi:hypothetical protein